jgi:hypothetical protein
MSLVLMEGEITRGEGVAYMKLPELVFIISLTHYNTMLY